MMKKLLTLTLAIVMVLSLTACGKETTTSNAPQNESQSATPKPIADKPVVKLYTDDETLVFELTDPSVAEFKQFTDSGEAGRVRIELGSLEVMLRKYVDKEGLGVGFNNSATTGATAWSTVAQPDSNVSYSITDNTLKISCKAHGYDTKELSTTSDGILAIVILKGENPSDDGAKFILQESISFKDIEISNEVPTV